jgi:hypothetical protein
MIRISEGVMTDLSEDRRLASVQVVLSATVRKESIQIDQVHKVEKQILSITVELALQETLEDPEAVPIVNFSVTSTAHASKQVSA